MSEAKVSCRLIAEADLPGIAELLAEGFPERGRSYWERGLQRLARYAPPAGYPRFGHMLDAAGRAVGVHLLICSQAPGDTPATVRCNVSSWYVQSAFRGFGSLLMMRGTRQFPGVYVNLQPRPETVPTIEAMGFRKSGQGVYAALPMLAGWRGMRVRLAAGREAAADLSIPDQDRRLLADHLAFGCFGAWCEGGGASQMLIFRRRQIKPGIPCAQLIHCASLDALERVAAPVGRFLAARGMPLLLVSTDRPLAGVPGKFFAEKLPIYCRGEPVPGSGDLGYTEAAVFGM